MSQTCRVPSASGGQSEGVLREMPWKNLARARFLAVPNSNAPLMAVFALARVAESEGRPDNDSELRNSAELRCGGSGTAFRLHARWRRSAPTTSWKLPEASTDRSSPSTIEAGKVSGCTCSEISRLSSVTSKKGGVLRHFADLELEGAAPVEQCAAVTLEPGQDGSGELGSVTVVPGVGGRAHPVVENSFGWRCGEIDRSLDQKPIL